jgi:hypothetical protein
MGQCDSIDNPFENINLVIALARNINITDIANLEPNKINDIIEIIYRLQNCPLLEIIEDQGYEA